MFRDDMELLLRVCTFPMTSLECYQNNYISELQETETHQEYQKKYTTDGKNSKSLQKALFQNLSRRCRIHNMDQIDLLFNKYFGYTILQKMKHSQKDQFDIMLHLLDQLANCFICHRNGRVALKYWESSNEEDFIGPYKGINKIALWNSLNRIMSTDILVIQYLLSNQVGGLECLDGYYSSIMLEDLQLEQVLQKGVAETHIHQGASLTFSVSWLNLMNLIRYNKKKDKDYDNEFLNNPYIESVELRPTVKVMAIIRILLALFLQKDSSITFKDFLLNDYLHNQMENVQRTREEIERNNFYEKMIIGVQKGHLIELEKEDEYIIHNEWDSIVAEFLPIHEMEDDYDDILDFIFNNYGVKRSIDTSGENIFLFLALDYANHQGEKDSWFQTYLWQYIRIKNQVFEAKVQFNTVSGLDYFQKYYRRSTQISCYEDTDYWKIIIRNQMQNPHLRKLELRCSVPRAKNETKIKKVIRKRIKSFLTAYLEVLKNGTPDDVPPPQIGFVFHLIKERDMQGIDKCWQKYHIDDSQPDKDSNLYFGVNQRKYVNEVKYIIEIRDSIPNLDKYILGIDAASIENNTEPWVFAKAYRTARDSKTSKLKLGKNRIQTLGFTFHVGEDFRHLITGLRHIDEVITHFGYHAGDRIGHGIALGVDVDYWIGHNPVVLLPRGEYLDNLLWIWGLCKEKKNHVNVDVSYLEQLIMKQAESIFGVIDGITVYILWKIYQSKFGDFELDPKFAYKFEKMPKELEDGNVPNLFCRFAPDNIELSVWNFEKLQYVLHCRCYLERLEECIQVEVTAENAPLMRELQKMLVDKISNQGIVVETNPTSNLAIGEISDMFHHYILNLNELSSEKCHNSIIVSINSDDPSVFNTNVSSEIAYIFYALQQHGYSREDALLWIDKVRGYGMNTSFIKDRNLSVEKMIEEMEGIIENLG